MKINKTRDFVILLSILRLVKPNWKYILLKMIPNYGQSL